MRRLLLATLMALAWSLPRPLLAQIPDTRERAAVQRVIVGYAESIQSGNLAAAEAMFVTGPDLHLITGADALHSWAEYRDGFLRPEIARFTGLRYTHSGIETVVKGDVAWSNFRWQMAGTANTPAPVLGRATAVLQKVDGAWKFVVLHFSR